MGALVGLGLAVILLFRLILYIMDRKEYARFINESQNAKWTAVRLLPVIKYMIS